MSVEQQQSSRLEHKSYPWVLLYLVGLLSKAFYLVERVRDQVECYIVYALWLYRFYFLPGESFTKVPRHVAILLDDDDYPCGQGEESSKCSDLKRRGRPVSTYELVALQQWRARMLVSSVDLYGYRESLPSSFQLIEGKKCANFLKVQPLYVKVEQDVKEYDLIIVVSPKSSVLRLSGMQPLSARQSEIIHFPFQSQINEFVLYRSMYLYNRKEQRHGK